MIVGGASSLKAAKDFQRAHTALASAATDILTAQPWIPPGRQLGASKEVHSGLILHYWRPSADRRLVWGAGSEQSGESIGRYIVSPNTKRQRRAAAAQIRGLKYVDKSYINILAAQLLRCKRAETRGGARWDAIPQQMRGGGMLCASPPGCAARICSPKERHRRSQGLDRLIPCQGRRKRAVGV